MGSELAITRAWHRGRARAAGLTAAGLLAAAAPALAHVEPERTTPRNGARASSASSASVTFGGPLRAGTLVVKRGSTKVSVGSGGRDPRNVKRLLVELRRGLKAGRYTASWSITAADGHKEKGSFRFTLR